MRSVRRWPFLALEGCDGVGKSTVRDALRDCLERAGVPCMMVGQHAWLNPRIGRVILNVREQRRRHDPDEIVRAYFHDKRLHASHTVEPALSEVAVIADRYTLSDAVYQEVLYGIPAEETLRLHREAGTLFPDLVVHVSVTAEEAYRRVLRRSKHPRHYERPAEMTQIMSVYQRLLGAGKVAWMPTTIEFCNDSPDWGARVANELTPSVLRELERLGLHAGAWRDES